MKTLIISHRDQDGITSAVSYAWNILEKENKPKTINELFSVCDIIDYNYHENIYDILKERNLSLDNYKQVVLCDCSFPLTIIKEFFNKFQKNFIWIDHHRLKDAEIEEEIKGITGIRDHNNSACVLVWKYFNKGAPEFVKYVEDMDLGKWELPNGKEFFAGLKDGNCNFTKEVVTDTFNLIDFDNFEEKKEEIIKKGKVIREHQRDHVQKISRSGKIVNFEGYKTFIINTIFHGSIISEFLWEMPEYKDIDIVLVYHKTQKVDLYRISMRSYKETVDLSVLAKKFGGGGHPRASGLSIKDIKKLDFKEWKE